MRTLDRYETIFPVAQGEQGESILKVFKNPPQLKVTNPATDTRTV
jgi:hypothetical protein